MILPSNKTIPPNIKRFFPAANDRSQQQTILPSGNSNGNGSGSAATAASAAVAAAAAAAAETVSHPIAILSQSIAVAVAAARDGREGAQRTKSKQQSTAPLYCRTEAATEVL